MPARRREPRWLDRRMVESLHDALIREHGGSFGVRDVALLESALARPQQKFAYAESPDHAILAAAYVFGVAKNHPFVDGNKRAAFMAAYVFLGMNGYDLDAREPDVAATVERVAAGTLSEAKLADWIRSRMRPSSE
jgi:death on curing protein